MRALFRSIDLVLTGAIAIGAASVSPKTKLKRSRLKLVPGFALCLRMLSDQLD
jgi:hypothetical protein